jgi:hypothetical protein
LGDHPEIFNGASLNLRNISKEDEHAAAIDLMPQVKQIWPVKIIPRPKVNRQLFGKKEGSLAKRDVLRSALLPHQITQVDRIQKDGEKGSGVKIGVIDTGVCDLKHPIIPFD